MFAQPVRFDSREFIRSFRKSYINFYQLWKQGREAPRGVDVQTPAQRPIHTEDLPEALAEAVRTYLKSSGCKQFTILKYMCIENGRITRLVEDARPLPPEDEIVAMSHTVTVNAADYAHVVTHSFVARAE